MQAPKCKACGFAHWQIEGCGAPVLYENVAPTVQKVLGDAMNQLALPPGEQGPLQPTAEDLAAFDRASADKWGARLNTAWPVTPTVAAGLAAASPLSPEAVREVKAAFDRAGIDLSPQPIDYGDNRPMESVGKINPPILMEATVEISKSELRGLAPPPPLTGRKITPEEARALIAAGETLGSDPQGIKRHRPLGLAPIRTEGGLNIDPTRGGVEADDNGLPLQSTAHPIGPKGKRPRLHAAALETVEISDENWTPEQKQRALMLAEGKRLVAIRRLVGLSQAKFCATFDVPLGTLRGWEHGRRPMPGHFKVLLLIIEHAPQMVLDIVAGKALARS